MIASNIPSDPEALLVKAEEDSDDRNALLESLFPDLNSTSRRFDVRYKAQCLVRRWSTELICPDARRCVHGWACALFRPPVAPTPRNLDVLYHVPSLARICPPPPPDTFVARCRSLARLLDHHVGTHCHGLRPIAAADGGRPVRRDHCQGPDSKSEVQLLRGCLVRGHDEVYAGRLDGRRADGA